MADFFNITPGVKELFDAQLRNPRDPERRTWCNVMDMMPWLPNAGQGTTVLDLGCGSGRVTIGLSKLWDPHANFVLADGDAAGEISRSQWGKFKDTGAGFYSRMDATREFVLANGVDDPEFITIDENLRWSAMPADVDVLISIYALGNHYPLDMYEDVYPRILVDGATVMFHNTNITPIPAYFEVVHRQPDSYKILTKIKSDGEFVVAKFNKNAAK